ncbi:hypothetical protein GVAV_003466 [Gurleya vavrai]
MSKIDVCILEHEEQWNHISLYCQLDFPTNLIFTKEIILKLVSIFKFLWRIKKIENLLKQLRKKDFDASGKIRILEYNNIIMKFYFYIFEEVIENEFKLEIKENLMMIDDLRKKINKILDNIFIKIFQAPKKGKEEMNNFLSSLEALCMSLGKLNITSFNDSDVRGYLKTFVSTFYPVLAGSTLFNLSQFV